jgi:hypothetical protein
MNGSRTTNDIASNLQAFNNVMQPTSAEAAAKLSERNQIESFEIKGYDLNTGLDYDKIFQSYLTTGFQATNFSKAVNEVNRMVNIMNNMLRFFLN